ncbi:hypothetical protein [Paraburkholderia sp. CI3]|uniref:hypothetical protein n=1 Tax=Paraburkholderia sp. CI3 TaxID=2991060 RepID=UPI003D19D11D
MRTSLEQAFALASPRIMPRATRLPGVLVHCGGVMLWSVLFARAFFPDGVGATTAGGGGF